MCHKHAEARRYSLVDGEHAHSRSTTYPMTKRTITTHAFPMMHDVIPKVFCKNSAISLEKNALLFSLCSYGQRKAWNLRTYIYIYIWISNQILIWLFLVYTPFCRTQILSLLFAELDHNKQTFKLNSATMWVVLDGIWVLHNPHFILKLTLAKQWNMKNYQKPEEVGKLKRILQQRRPKVQSLDNKMYNCEKMKN